MKATPEALAGSVRRLAIRRIAVESGMDALIVVGCLNAGHRRYTDRLDAIADELITAALNSAEAGVFTLASGHWSTERKAAA